MVVVVVIVVEVVVVVVLGIEQMTRRSGSGTIRVGRLGPNLQPGMACVCGMNGWRKGMNTIQHQPSPASRAGADVPINVRAASQAVSNVNTHRPRFQVRARPS